MAEIPNGKAKQDVNLLGSLMVYEHASFSGSSMARFSARKMDSVAHTFGEESRDDLLVGKVVRNVGESNHQF